MLRRDQAYSRLITASLVVLSIVTVAYVFVLVNEDYYMCHKDPNHFEYLESPAQWYLRYLVSDSEKSTTDVLTQGYIAYTAVESGISRSHSPPQTPNMLSTEEVLLLLEPTNIQNGDETLKNYIINTRLHYVTIERWNYLSSWSNYINILNQRPFLNKIYSNQGTIFLAA